MAKRTQNRTRVTRKRTSKKNSEKVTMMPVVVRASPEDTQGIIGASVDYSTGSPRAAIPVAVKGKKGIRRRAAVIPVAVKTLPQPRPTRRTTRPEADNPTSVRDAFIGIADELIEAEINMFRLGFHYVRAMTTGIANTLIGRPMARLEQEIQATQFVAPGESKEHETLLRVA